MNDNENPIRKMFEDAGDEAAKSLREAIKGTAGGTIFNEYLRLRPETRRFDPIPQLKIDPIKWEEVHDYASARALIENLNRYYDRWMATIDAELQITILAMLSNGAVVNVSAIREEGYNGIGIQGTINGMPCLILQHQASLQFVCITEKVEAPIERKKIGFIYASRPDE